MSDTAGEQVALTEVLMQAPFIKPRVNPAGPAGRIAQHLLASDWLANYVAERVAEAKAEALAPVLALHVKGTSRRSGGLAMICEDICLGCSEIGKDEDDKGVVYSPRPWPCPTVLAGSMRSES